MIQQVNRLTNKREQCMWTVWSLLTCAFLCLQSSCFRFCSLELQHPSGFNYLLSPNSVVVFNYLGNFPKTWLTIINIYNPSKINESFLAGPIISYCSRFSHASWWWLLLFSTLIVSIMLQSFFSRLPNAFLLSLACGLRALPFVDHEEPVWAQLYKP